LVGLKAVGLALDDPAIRRAVAWLARIQRPDGGWGETNDSYHDPALAGQATRSTAFQTAWAILALLAAGECESEVVARGIEFLLACQGSDGLWVDDEFTAPGFPRVFYLKYHGYAKYFPLWALASYRNCRAH
jgi:squalene-hopene/tetraprenyl-beta-curcumene cyclase